MSARMGRRMAAVGLWVVLAWAPPAGMCSEPVMPPPGRPTVTALAWLAGTWTCERNGRVVTEMWMQPAGGTMLGASRTTAQGRTVEYEFVVLREEPAGEIAFTAHPSGQAAATFTLVRAGATEVVFENLAHDFPQRISYTLQPDGGLLAAIEGERAGRKRRVEFPYRRGP